MGRDIFKLVNGITNQVVVGYARYSSDMQANGWTIQAQMRTITDYCEGKGYRLVATTTDEAKSGKSTQRDGLQEALSYIRRDEANVLMVCKLDRATRDAPDAFGLERELRGLGASLYCIEQNIDTSDPNALMLFGIHAVMAQHYRRNLAGETAKGKKARVDAGLANGDPPYGYRRATAGDLLHIPDDADALQAALRRLPYIVVPEHAEVVRLAFTLYVTGTHSDQTIAQELNRRGYRIVSKHHPAGGPFTRDTITAMLQNPLYCGCVSYAGLKTHGKLDLKLHRRHGRAEYREGKHEPIISPDLFGAVQALRTSRRRVGPARESSPTTGRVYPAARLVRCSACGERLRANYACGKPVYRCSSRERGIACTAHRRRIDGATVHNCVAAFIAAIHLPDDWRARAMDAAMHDEVATQQHARRRTLENKRAHLKSLVKDDIIPVEEYRADVATIDAELATLAHEPGIADLEVIAQRLDNLGDLWEHATDEERQELAAGLIDAISCDLDGKAILGIKPHEEFHPLQVAFPAVWSFCGTDGLQHTTKTTHKPLEIRHRLA